ncbi:MAG: hypothetical protein V7K64_29780 [Nostoc sp.]|uniref:hypothetical protein n=1 Tax=Nostoc sp. TaxID=1180 RepID=UPI002FF6627C
MRYKLYILKVLTLILTIFVWWMSGNPNLTANQAVATTCIPLGKIISVKDGFVERKKPQEIYKPIGRGIILCDGELLKTKSNSGKTVKVTIDCLDPSLRDWKLFGNQKEVGVANGCKSVGGLNIPPIE